MALKKCKMHMVVANELLTCKDEVVVVTSNEKISVHRYKTQPYAITNFITKLCHFFFILLISI